MPRRLIDISLLAPAEVEWLDAYHRAVIEKLAPHLDDDDRTWLEAACAPLNG